MMGSLPENSRTMYSQIRKPEEISWRLDITQRVQVNMQLTFYCRCCINSYFELDIALLIEYPFAWYYTYLVLSLPKTPVHISKNFTDRYFS